MTPQDAAKRPPTERTSQRGMETLERLSTFWSTVALVLTALTVIAGGIALVFSSRLSADLRIALSGQQEKTAKAERELLELKERIRQRSLTQEQREHLISSLKPIRMGWFEIWSKLGDPESASFAEQFADLFGEVGWGTQSRILYDAGAPEGVTIRVHSKDKIPEFAAHFVQAAREIGLHMAVSSDPDDQRLSETRVYLIVGSKPTGSSN